MMNDERREWLAGLKAGDEVYVVAGNCSGIDTIKSREGDKIWVGFVNYQASTGNSYNGGPLFIRPVMQADRDEAERQDLLRVITIPDDATLSQLHAIAAILADPSTGATAGAVDDEGREG
jgi:hypothetical protein